MVALQPNWRLFLFLFFFPLLFICCYNAESDSRSNKKLLMQNCGHIIRTFNSDILSDFQCYYKPVSVLTAKYEWITYPSQKYRKAAVKIMLGVNLNVIMNPASNLDQIVF